MGTFTVYFWCHDGVIWVLFWLNFWVSLWCNMGAFTVVLLVSSWCNVGVQNVSNFGVIAV